MLIDRFIDSTLAYQHYGMGINKIIINRLNDYLLEKIKIDFTFLNLVNMVNLKLRLSKRQNLNRYDNFKISFYKKIQNGYIKITKKNKKKYLLINSNDSINTHNMNKGSAVFDELDEILEQEISFSAIDDDNFDVPGAVQGLDDAPVITQEKPTKVVSPARPIKPKQQNDNHKFVPEPSAKEKFEALLNAEPPKDPLPSLDLLDRPDKHKNPISEEELEAVSRLVEVKLLDFNIQAAVVGVYPGPVVTRFELDLAPGIKVAKITGLAKDLARSLSAVSVRVVEVIPGKTYVGLELPNKHREIVRLSEVINAPKFEQNASPLTMVLGKDIAGEPVVADLAKMPHLLVAGTTGSGKSVGVNVMILSLL